MLLDSLGDVPSDDERRQGIDAAIAALKARIDLGCMPQSSGNSDLSQTSGGHGGQMDDEWHGIVEVSRSLDVC